MAYAPDRLRIGVRLVALAAAVALASGTLLDVYDTAEVRGPLGPALDDAVAAVWPSALLAGVLGVVARPGGAGSEAPRAACTRAAGRATAAVAALGRPRRGGVRGQRRPDR